jgi:hypothetical protein
MALSDQEPSRIAWLGLLSTFQKAFDRLEHKVILDVLAHKGFGVKWIS